MDSNNPGMTSGHPGMQSGTPQSGLANGMLGDLPIIGITAITGPIFGAIGEGLGGVVDAGGGAAEEGGAAGMGGDAGGGLDSGGDPPVDDGAGNAGDPGAGGSGNPPVVVNLGGEGEIPGAINQNGPWILDDGWQGCQGSTLQELQDQGNQFVVSSNTNLPFPTGSVDTVYTNSVPIDIDSFLGPGVQSTEILRILSPGGTWIKTDAEGIVTTVLKPL